MNFFIRIILHLSVFFLVCGDNLIDELQSNKDYKEIFKHPDQPYGVLFYHSEGSQPLQSRVLTLMEEAVIVLKESKDFMKFFMLNCNGEGIKKDKIKECKHRRSFYAFKGVESEKFDLRVLYNVESFLAQMMMFVYASDIGIVTNANDWEYEQTQAIAHNQDLVFSHVNGLGDKSHYYFMVYAASHLTTYRFALSTDKDVSQSLCGPNKGSCIIYAKCSKAENIPCEKTIAEGQADSPGAIANAVLNQKIPAVFSFDLKESGEVDDLNNVNILWCFVENEDAEKKFQSHLKNVIKSLSNSGLYARAITVDKSKHTNLTEFGIYDDTILPFVAIELSEEFKESHERQFEMFPPDSDITEEEIVKFASDVLKDVKKYSDKIASIFEISAVSLSDWEQPGKQNKRKIFALGCSSDEDYRSSCIEASTVFRRIVRSLYVDDVVDVEYIYVDHTGKPKSSAENKIPSIRLFLPGKEEMIYPSTSDNPIIYEELLIWMSEHIGFTVKSLPSSGSDFVPLGLKSEVDVNKENLLGRDDVLTELEEDEVAKDALEMRKKFYKDDVIQLTDENFNKTLQENKMVVVFFYTEWDDSSFLFQPHYANVYKNIMNSKDGKLKNILVRKVDCYGQYLTCLYENVVTYPSIRIYKDGKFLANYNGVFDEESVIRALNLYYAPPLKKLPDELVHLETFITSTSEEGAFHILGYFKEESSEDMKTLESISRKYHGKYHFSYTTSLNAEETFGFSGESDVIGYLPTDPWQIQRHFDKKFTYDNLDKFIIEKSLPYFGELTAKNFPHFRLLGKPFMLLFTNREKAYESILSKALYKLFEEKELDNVTLVWMDTNIAMNKAIRRSYLGHSVADEQELVIVDHSRGEVYAFEYSAEQDKDETMLSEGIKVWLSDYQSNDLSVTSVLKSPKWKPLREGFDFLHYIDHGLPRESSDDDDDNEDDVNEVGNYGHYKPSDRPVFHGLKAPRKLRNSDAGSYYGSVGDVTEHHIRDEL